MKIQFIISSVHLQTLTILLLTGLIFMFSACSSGEQKQNVEIPDKIGVFVSILPVKYFVERIGGENVQISVMVGPGQSPATYEPSPKQMSELSESSTFIRIGVPYENSLMKKISANNPQLKIVDLRDGIELKPIDRHGLHSIGEHHDEHEGHSHEGEMDPHIWLSPKLVKTQAGTIRDALTAVMPQKKSEFESNYNSFIDDLTSLENDLNIRLSSIESREFLVFHPSWGYFSDDFNLIQIPIETSGKEPGAEELAKIIDFVKSKNIKVVFVQEQFSKKSANAIAEQIDGKVVSIDPLAEDYLSNLMKIADVFSSELK